MGYDCVPGSPPCRHQMPPKPAPLPGQCFSCGTPFPRYWEQCPSCGAERKPSLLDTPKEGSKETR